VIGTIRTATVVEIPDHDLRDVWESFGGSVGESEEDSGPLTYLLTVQYFPSAVAARRHLKRDKSD